MTNVAIDGACLAHNFEVSMEEPLRQFLLGELYHALKEAAELFVRADDAEEARKAWTDGGLLRITANIVRREDNTITGISIVSGVTNYGIGTSAPPNSG